ncbi:ATPase domain protein [Mycobacterium kansasii]|uniref:ATPase domain protein n=1 Tax=Mycobacterium kansasii TaxID=1768 RepID=A0A1V3X4U2_MYCKA|nr:ATPase domain protein [Mycobacterium kansasii]
MALEATGMGMATGAWRVGIYLLGDGDSHPRLSSGWRSVMSGPKSLPEPVRTVDINGVDELARLWALPTTPGAPAPGLYRRPFEFQTLLASTQLAKCFHLPELETPGFRVSPAPTFSVSRPQPNDSVPAIDIGQIMNQRRPSALNYRVELDQLTRHTFIAGLTGAGKTNTLMHLLTQAASAAYRSSSLNRRKRSTENCSVIRPSETMFEYSPSDASTSRRCASTLSK